MNILKTLQYLFKSTPNLENITVIENLKAEHNVEGLIAALTFRSSDQDTKRKYKFTGVIATALGDLGDVRATAPLEKVLSNMDSKISFWQDMEKNMSYGFQMAETQKDYKSDMEVFDSTRPKVIQALRILGLTGKEKESDTRKQILLQGVALLWELRAKRRNETTAQADPSFWAFLDESGLEMELQQGMATLNDDERIKVQAVLNKLKR